MSACMFKLNNLDDGSTAALELYGLKTLPSRNFQLIYE